jgi:hypothetical protein
MGRSKRTILVDPICLRRGLKEAICSFCSDVLVSRGLLRSDALDEPGINAEQDRVVSAVSRCWQSREVAFEPDDPPSAQSVLESGAMTPAAIDAIDRFCREALIPAGLLAKSDWDSRALDSHKYAIARRISRGWVSGVQVAD